MQSRSRPAMKSIWDDVFPKDADHCYNNIVEVLYNSKTLGGMYTPNEGIGKLEIFLDIMPFNELDIQGKTIQRKLTAFQAFVFGFPAREFFVGQMLKRIDIYPDIVRFDLVTTGSLLRFECDNYEICDLPAEN